MLLALVLFSCVFSRRGGKKKREKEVKGREEWKREKREKREKIHMLSFLSFPLGFLRFCAHLFVTQQNHVDITKKRTKVQENWDNFNSNKRKGGQIGHLRALQCAHRCLLLTFSVTIRAFTQLNHGCIALLTPLYRSGNRAHRALREQSASMPPQTVKQALGHLHRPAPKAGGSSRLLLLICLCLCQVHLRLPGTAKNSQDEGPFRCRHPRSSDRSLSLRPPHYKSQLHPASGTARSKAQPHSGEPHISLPCMGARSRCKTRR